MKCKICGFDIEEGQTSCPGCGTNVEQLKQAGNVVYEEGTTVSNTPPVTPVAEPVVEPTPVTPVAEPVVEPTPVTPVAEPVAEPTPVTPVAEPVAEPTSVTPVAEPVAEPTPVTPVAEPVVEPTSVTPVAEPVVEPTPVTPVAEPVAEPTPVTPVAEPVVESTPVTPVTEPVVEPTPVVTPENTESPIANPVIPPIDDNTQMASLDDDKPAKEPKEHKKNKGLIITLIVILVVLLIVAGVGAYFHFIYGAPVKVFSRTVDGVKTTLNNQVPSSDVIGASFNIGFNYSDSTNSNMSFLNDLKITDATQVDKATGNSLSSIIFKYNDTDLKMNFLTKDNSSYLYAPDFFDKYLILSSADDTTSDSSLNKIDSYTEHTTELKDLITHITSALSTSVSKDYFTKTYAKETINGKSEMVAKIELTLTKEQIKTVETNFLTSIKNDDQATKDLAVLMNISAQEVKEQIDTYLSSLDITTDKLDLVLYTDLTTTKLYKGVLTSTTGIHEKTF